MYQPSTGRFDTVDPFFGMLDDPQSLHNYVYVHADPVNGIDPTGLFSLSIGLAGLSITSSILTFTDGPQDAVRGSATRVTSLKYQYRKALFDGFKKREDAFRGLYDAMAFWQLERKLLIATSNVNTYAFDPQLKGALASFSYDANRIRIPRSNPAQLQFDTIAHEAVHAYDKYRGWYTNNSQQEGLAYAVEYHIAVFDKLLSIKKVARSSPYAAREQLNNLISAHLRNDYRAFSGVDVKYNKSFGGVGTRPITMGDIRDAQTKFGIRFNIKAIRGLFPELG